MLKYLIGFQLKCTCSLLSYFQQPLVSILSNRFFRIQFCRHSFRTRQNIRSQIFQFEFRLFFSLEDLALCFLSFERHSLFLVSRFHRSVCINFVCHWNLALCYRTLISPSYCKLFRPLLPHRLRSKKYVVCVFEYDCNFTEPKRVTKNELKKQPNSSTRNSNGNSSGNKRKFKWKIHFQNYCCAVREKNDWNLPDGAKVSTVKMGYDDNRQNIWEKESKKTVCRLFAMTQHFQWIGSADFWDECLKVAIFFCWFLI